MITYQVLVPLETLELSSSRVFLFFPQTVLVRKLTWFHGIFDESEAGPLQLADELQLQDWIFQEMPRMQIEKTVCVLRQDQGPWWDIWIKPIRPMSTTIFDRMSRALGRMGFSEANDAYVQGCQGKDRQDPG